MFQQFLKDEKGQTTVEYILIIAVIAVVITVFGKKAQEGMANITQQVFKNVSKEIDVLMSHATQ